MGGGGTRHADTELTNLPIETAESDFGFGTFSWVEWRLLFQTELSEIERYVVLELYVNEATQRQTAQHCGMSQAQVSRMHRRACQKLRDDVHPNVSGN
jgi:DNA-directed RNA polymerase specialized sigma24 family protein